MLKYFTGIILVFFIFGCDPIVILTYTRPLPENSHDIDSIPKSIQGHYLCLNDSTILIVTKTTIKEYFSISISAAKDQLLSEGLILNNDTIIVPDKIIEPKFDSTGLIIKYDSIIIPEFYRGKCKVIIKDDSIFGIKTCVDTLINLSSGDKMRKFKKSYLLNRKNKEFGWTIKELKALDDNGLVLISQSGAKIVRYTEGKIEVKDFNFLEITEVLHKLNMEYENVDNAGRDTIRYKISPNKRQLNKILHNLYKDSIYYKKNNTPTNNAFKN